MESQAKTTVKSNNTTLKKKQRRGAFTLRNKNAENFIKKVISISNNANDPGSPGRGSPVSETGSEPRTPNAHPLPPMCAAPPPPALTRSMGTGIERNVPGSGSPVSETGSEPRTPNSEAPSPSPLISRSLALIPKPKRKVRFTNNTTTENKNTRGNVKKITLESFPYLNESLSYNTLSPNNRYAKNLSNARLGTSKVSRKGRKHLPKQLSRMYAELIHIYRNSSQTYKNISEHILRDRRLTPKQQSMLLGKLKFNFGK